VFIDETWIKTNMTPLRGRTRRGERLVAKATIGPQNPHIHRRAPARSNQGSLRLRRAHQRPKLTAYVEQILVPTLRPGDVVVLDNPGIHKGQAVRRAIRAAGAKLFFLSPYSPDLNPIEQVFAKLKHVIRKAQERSLDDT
jgi:hypothetical protein